MKAFKTWTLLALSLVLVLSLAACGSSNNNGGGAKTGDNGGSKQTDNNKGSDKTEKIDLTFWSLGENGYEGLVDEWNAAHPNVQVSVQNTGDQTVHHNNLLTAMQAGKGAPDIFMLEIGFMETFKEAQDQFQNLNDFGAEDLKGMYLDWKWQQSASTDGSYQIGLPTDVGPTVIFYRADLAEAAGLPADPDGFSAALNTWDKFAQVAKDYKDKTGKAFADTTDLLFNAVRDQSDGEIYYSKADGSFIGDSNPQVRKAYDFTVKAIQEGWVSNVGMWSPEWGAATADGDFMVMLAPAWMSGVIQGNAPETSGKWKLAQIPEGAGNWGGSFLTLPKEGKHPQEAYEFISWLVNKENQLKSFKSNTLMPSIPELYTDTAFTDFTSDFFSGQQIAVEFAKAADRVKPMFYGPLHDSSDAIMKEALRNVIDTGADPESEWNTAIEKIKQIVSRG